MSRHPLGVRLWMLSVFVAIVAVCLGGHAMHRRSERFRILSLQHAVETRNAIASARKAEADVKRRDDQLAVLRHAALNAGNDRRAKARLATLYDVTESIAAQSRALAERFRREAERHALLQRRYLRAAQYPWISVAPDPPEPK